MKAALIREFGPPDAIVFADAPRPEPAPGQVLVRVKAAGVGPWDALIREGKAAVSPPLPVILGSDFSGVVEAAAPGAAEFQAGDEVFGATNEQFTGAYAEYVCASAKMIARKPARLSFIEAASVPVVAVTAWQMLFEYGHAAAGQTVLIHGAAGNVGAYAVQFARNAGLHIIATASSRDSEYLRSLGAERIVDYQQARFEDGLQPVDLVLDMIGGDVLERSLRVLIPTGMLVSVASPIPQEVARRCGQRAVFFLVDVTTSRLNAIAAMIDSGEVTPQVGTVLPLDQARRAHEMLAGAPHARGKIVLSVAP
ncbi:MAG TPA: NADP-dependent oxidoreductase [Candidatus Baltobacteraceae bacterium]|nr:NADP-dependent oxidoreductase [Candidatus Baltobacteraceae bacterium]